MIHRSLASKKRLERTGKIRMVPSMCAIAVFLQFQKIVDANKSSTLYLQDEFREELMAFALDTSLQKPC